MDELFGKGIEPIVLLQVFIYASATLVVLALPLAILLASLMTMGNLGEYYELAAIKSSGISIFRVVSPMFYHTVALTIFSLWFSFYVIPIANLKLYSLLYDIQNVKAAVVLKPGHFYKDIDNYTIHIHDKNVDRDMLYGLTIDDHREEKLNHREVLADSGMMHVREGDSIMKMTLFSGVVHQMVNAGNGNQPNQPYMRYYFDTLIYRFKMEGFSLDRTEERKFSRHQMMLNIERLVVAIDSIEGVISENYERVDMYMKPYFDIDSSITHTKVTDTLKKEGDIVTWFPEKRHRDILNKSVNNARAIKNYADFVSKTEETEQEALRRFKIEFHMKFSLPVACIIFLFIGAPLGAIIRKGGIGFPVIISVGFFILFYVLMMQGKKFAKMDVLPVWMGVWLPVLVLTPIAIWVTWQSSNDSKLFDFSSWKTLFRRLFRKS